MRQKLKSVSGGSLLLSVTLHAALFAVFFWGWQAKSEQREIVKPNYVRAKLVQLEAQAEAKKPVENKPNIVDLTKKREAQERQRRLEEQKKKQALQRQQEEAKKREAEKKAAAERQRKEAERKEAERIAKAKAEAERQRLEQQRLEREQQARQQALAAERAQALEASYRTTAESYMAAIADRIERNWSRPPSARNNMQCELLIQLVPTGRVINVDVIKSSGSELFDRSAVQAVRKAEQFPEIKEMSIEVFERYYRELTLVFKPQDLRQ